MAAHDALTGLINRREFERRLDDALNATHEGVQHVLCYLDIDRFKVVNDECGHKFGDTLLREVAALINGAVPESSVVARLGGDEFGVLLTDCPLNKARQITDDLVRAIADLRFVWLDKTFSIAAWIGLVEVTAKSTSIDDLLHAADSACYIARNLGGHVHVYTVRDEADARRRGEIQWLQVLQTALKEDRFELVAQPIAHASIQQEGRPRLEILLRLKDEKGVSIAPAEFMRAAERYRLMSQLDRWVVQTSLTLLARGAIRGATDCRLCIHLSGQTLGDTSFPEFVVNCINRTSVAPSRICFLVTEYSRSTGSELARQAVEEFQKHGFEVQVLDPIDRARPVGTPDED